MSKPVYPVLTTMTSYLTNIQEITASVVRWVMKNPGNISTTTEDELVSFRELAAICGDDKDTICNKLESGFLSILNRYFTDLKPVVLITHSPYEDDDAQWRYNITIDISYLDKSGNTIAGISSGMFLVDSDNRITVKYGNTK